MVPFAVKTRQASVGVMITASHNPKDDNGYKVYGSNGCQINTPVDQAIARSILENWEPKTWSVQDVRNQTDSMPDILDKYVRAIVRSVRPIGHAVPSFVYTPMHGVGLRFMAAALHNLNRGEADVIAHGVEAPIEHGMQGTPIFKVVDKQALPDPDFPTVAFPNPEEYGALDLAKEEADRAGCMLIIANDPDADRLAVAQKLHDGTWYQFKGDEVGMLLGHHMFQMVKARQKTEERSDKPFKMITSAVSSQMLSVYGNRNKLEVEETLTGFKWIGNRAQEYGQAAIFGYEEALGYMLPDVVHDKDGVAAACLFLRLCSEQGQMPYDILQELYRSYGYFETTNTYWKSPNTSLTGEVFDRIRAHPRAILESFWPSAECRVRDAVAGTDSGNQSGISKLPVVPDNLMITLWFRGDEMLQDGVRLTIRASGTEPKIKGEVISQSSAIV